MTTGVKPESGKFGIDVNGQPEITKNIEVSGRQALFFWFRGFTILAVGIEDRFDEGGNVSLKTVRGHEKVDKSIRLSPGENRSWNNELLLYHKIDSSS